MKKDRLRSICRDEVEEQNPSACPTEIQCLIKQKIEEQVERVKADFQREWHSINYEGPVFVQKGS